MSSGKPDEFEASRKALELFDHVEQRIALADEINRMLTATIRRLGQRG